MSAAPGDRRASTDFLELPGTRIRFASASEGRAVLGTVDDYIRTSGEVQRRALMPAGTEPTEAAFAAWQADNVVDWPAAERQRWERALQRLAPRLQPLGLPLPPRVLLVRSTGRESAQTPHTRGDAIVLPAGADLQGFDDADLLAHELFHVLSRARPEWSSRLYELLGYEAVAELQWPSAWTRIRIANPDAPKHRHAMSVNIQGQTRHVMPVVVAARDRIDTARGETIEHLLDVRLLEVLPGQGGQPTRAAMRDGQPVWHRVPDVPDFLRRLGGNTDYVLHAEETLADNVMLLASGRAVPNPALLRQLAPALRATPSALTAPSRSSDPGWQK